MKIVYKKNANIFCISTQQFIDTKLEQIQNFKVYEDDIWVISYPKCGTTWTQEMVWMLNNDLNYKKAAEIKLVDRFPFME
jgi:hypothetical protein